jgi:putative transcription antitermination factor YqgF
LRQAHPLTTIHGEANTERFAAIAALIGEWRPTHLVVGRPTSLDGTPHAMTARCRRFADQLRGRFGLGVDLRRGATFFVRCAGTAPRQRPQWPQRKENISMP